MTPSHHDAFYESDEFARGIFDALAEGVLVVDNHDRIVAINPSAELLLGFEHRTLLGVNITDSPWVIEDEQGRTLRSEAWPTAQTMRSGEPTGRLVVISGPSGAGKTRKP